MANTLSNELQGIVSYSLCQDSNRIINISDSKESLASDTIKVLTILDRLFINYSIDEDYNFQLHPEYSFRGNL